MKFRLRQLPKYGILTNYDFPDSGWPSCCNQRQPVSPVENRPYREMKNFPNHLPRARTRSLFRKYIIPLNRSTRRLQPSVWGYGPLRKSGGEYGHFQETPEAVGSGSRDG